MEILVAILGSLAPLLVASLLLRAEGASAIASVGLVAASAALNSVWPSGGGMAVDGSWRVRLFRREWTFDSQRSRRERVLGPLALGLVTVGGFVIALPLLAALHAALAPWTPVADERLALGALLSMVAVAMARHRPEVPLARWVREAGAGPLAPALWEKRVRALERIAAADGAIGNVGGVGALTVGLHEHLDALAILAKAQAAGIAGASELRARALGHLAGRREGEGYPIYPGALPRKDYTERASAALAEPAPRLNRAAEVS